MGQMFLEGEDHVGEFEWEVEQEGSNIDQYEDMLSKYQQWISSKREIKLASLLNPGRKVQFEIDSLSLLATAEDSIEESLSYAISLSKAAIHIKGMSFILKEGIVEKLTLKCRRMETPMGKTISELIDSCVELSMRQHTIKGQISRFYIYLGKKDAA